MPPHLAGTRPVPPYLSVIIPVHQGSAVLDRCLDAVVASDFPRECWELIVVDDASSDDSALVGARYADKVVRLGGRPHGPAYARNRGVEIARGEVITFIDADVRIHRDTLSRIAATFAQESEVAALFGAYDTTPAAKGFVSQYRNLLHHYVHARSAGEAETFWAGCGAMRRDVFVAAGMYDEWSFPRPQIEDVELGHRVRALGHRIVLRPDIQCTHLKRWTMKQVLMADFRDRGVPWTRLLIQQGRTTKENTLNLRTVEKLNTILIAVMLVLAAAALVARSLPLAYLSAFALLCVLVLNRHLYAFFARTRGLLFALGVVPLHTLYYVNNAIAFMYGWLLHQLFGSPSPDAVTQAYAEVGAQMWPPVPNRTRWESEQRETRSADD